jgi:hypothetical protein
MLARTAPSVTRPEGRPVVAMADTTVDVAAETKVVHIRQRASRVWTGNQFYNRHTYDTSPQRLTLCGEPAGLDMSWAETRWEKYLAYVSCEECRVLRAQG